MSAASSGPVSSEVGSLFQPVVEQNAGGGEDGAGTETEITDGPAGTTQADEAETGEEETGGADGAETGSETGTIEDDLDALIDQFAEEMGLDMNDPNQRKIAKRLADKESFIRKQRSEIESLKKGGEEEPDYMAEFTKSLDQGESERDKGAGKEERPATDSKTETKSPAGQPQKFGDVGDSWNKPEDAYEQLNQKYAEGDFRGVHDIETALFVRRAYHILLPEVNKLLDQKLGNFRETELGDLRKVTEDRSHEQAKEYAQEQLAKIPKFAAVAASMFEAEDGDFLEFEGKQYPNTPFNQIIARFPNLRYIQIPDKDPGNALKKTYFAKFLEAAKIYDQLLQGKSLKTGEAKALLDEAEKANKQREAQTRVRQTLNAGSGATGLGKSKTARNYVDELNSLPGEKSTSSLF